MDRKKRKKAKIHWWRVADSGVRVTICGLAAGAGSGVRLAIGGFDGDTANCDDCLSSLSLEKVV